MAKVDLIDYSEVGDFLSRVYTSENALEDISVAVATRNKKVLKLYLTAVQDKCDYYKNKL
jgi:hypothetical protein